MRTFYHRTRSLAVLDASGGLRWSKSLGNQRSAQIAAVSGGWIATTGPVMKAKTTDAIQRLDASGDATWATAWTSAATRTLEVSGDRVLVTGIASAPGSLGAASIARGDGVAAAFSAKDGTSTWTAAWPSALEVQASADTVVVAFSGASPSVPASKKEDRASMIVLRLP